jgi:thiol reductant ABC exporter CydD subunit
VRALDPRLLRRARPVRVLLSVDVALGVVTAVLLIVQATLLAHVIVRAFDGAPLSSVKTSLVLLLVVFFARGLIAWAFEALGVRAAADVLSSFRLELAERRMRAQPAALDGVEAGEIVAASVDGTGGLAAYFGRYLPQAVLACIVPVAVLVWVFTLDVTSGLVMLATLPAIPVFMWLIGRYTEERTRERWLALRLLSTHFLDVVRGLPTLRLLNRSRDQVERVAEVSERYRRATMSTLRVAFLSGSVLELAATLGVALVAVTVGVRLAHGGVGFEPALTVLVLAPELYFPLRQLGAQFHASADGLAVAERMLTLLDAPDEVSGGGRRSAPIDAPIRLESVTFAYPSRQELVLDGVDLELLPGETVALVGESGAGKTTIAALLLRLAEPSSGRVTVGGVDLAECDVDAWRARVAWLPQHPTIVRGTVADNVRLGASSGSVRQAAALAGVDVALDTEVGDGGQPLSAGERRRIGLARAFLRDAAFVVLDEPTADLDPDNAELITEAIEQLCADRTVLLVTHRLDVARVADRIVVLERGRIAEAALA